VDGPPAPPIRNDSGAVSITPKVPHRDPAAVITQVNGQLQDIFFEYDRAELRQGGLIVLQQNAALLIPILREFPRFTVLVEGHCDERGSAEYNLGLGDHRAARIAEILSGLGVSAAQLRKVSYGKEMPQCNEASESCWQRNRRAHLRLAAAE
jgi:peptidoglycan-associated lipoprotein